jgi:hypothetical protein
LAGLYRAGNFTDYPIWAFGLLMFFAVGILSFLALLGFKLLAPNMKSIETCKIHLVSTLVDCGFNSDINWNKTSKRICSDGRVVKKKSLI